MKLPLLICNTQLQILNAKLQGRSQRGELGDKSPYRIKNSSNLLGFLRKKPHP